MIRDNAVRAERERRIPDQVVEALTATGLHRMTVPRRYGGYQTGATAQAEVFTTIAEACGSTAWVEVIHVSAARIVALFPDEAQDEVFSTPDVRVSGVFNPTMTATPTGDGYVVDGRSSFNTGCLHAQWDTLITTTAPVDGRPPELLWVLVPMSDLEVLDDWDVTGLIGTGSNTVVAHDLFVPAHRVLPVAPALADGRFRSETNSQDPYYRAALMPYLCAITCATFLGLANAALADFTERIHRRGITYTDHQAQHEAPITHFQLAEATMKTACAEHLTTHTARLAEAGETDRTSPTVLDRVRARANMGYVARIAKEAVDVVSSASGGSSLRTTAPIQRISRDIRALSLHALVSPTTNLELLGRTLAGLTPSTTFL
ncbi:alkylation response protein AidB-like acyl-CoA dehydrogenase [Saccharothrix tamanrassetensis]|uniref:Alkylation response protein AidB-like acyl-CoA dehydrogenase n=1 Tax=Saccharothrix tamanrassetensis TaxID=1051531 RepID=A0A841CUS2_9PSEU|nr:acyl-CoA dehydrogenase family protein [Saccharothrix tamanrassetensis]MBB5959777.1 alkylation response protein AidB-like acyl-CoA dehydrogenase [Saccharothrix tamanrassetensis]